MTSSGESVYRDEHHQGSVCTVWRLQQCRQREDELFCDIRGRVPSAADSYDLLLFTHRLRVTFQGITTSSTVFLRDHYRC